MSKTVPGTRSIWARASSPAVRRYAFIGFATLVALTGGASRADVASLVVLRPLAFLLAAYALLLPASPTDRVGRAAFWLLGVAALAVAWQLIPLPPPLWQALPVRDGIARIDALLGLEGLWRPVALSLDGAWNALFALSVPLAGLLLYTKLEPGDRRLLPSIWLAIATASATLGILQMLGPPEGPLYFYRNSTAGMPVGLFANNNHQAVFLATSMPVAFLWAGLTQRNNGARLLAALAAAALFLVVVALTQSRAGIGVALGGGLLASFMLIQRFASGDTAPKPGTGQRSSQRKQALGGKLRLFAARKAYWLAAALATVLLVLGVAILRSSAFLHFDPSQEMRVLALPTVLHMVGEHWVAGVGGGSFDEAFRIYEPTNLLSRYYLNQAHNDWLQVPIEYGLLGISALLLAVVLFATAIWSVVRSREFAWSNRLAIAFPPLGFAAASLVDYPLRSPTISFLLICWLVAMSDHQRVFGGVGPGKRRGASSSVYHQTSIR